MTLFPEIPTGVFLDPPGFSIMVWSEGREIPLKILVRGGLKNFCLWQAFVVTYKMGREKKLVGGKYSRQGKGLQYYHHPSPLPLPIPPPQPPLPPKKKNLKKQLQLQWLHDCFFPYKTQYSSTKRTSLKVLDINPWQETKLLIKLLNQNLSLMRL